MPFKYSKVLVLGATSGIGWAMSKKFLDEGSSVIAVGRRKENLHDFAQQYDKDGKVDIAVFDITDLKAIPQFVEDIMKKHPNLDCVFMNSGIQRHVNWKEPESVDLNMLEVEFKTNYKQAPKEVSIIYVTSGLALVPIVYCPNYCASKAALHHMVMMLRLQMKELDSNVKIIELLPPAVQTELHDDKHQPEFKGNGRNIGMPLDEFVEEAYAGLNSEDNEQIPVQMVKNFMGPDGFEVERQKKMLGMYEMMKKQRS